MKRVLAFAFTLVIFAGAVAFWSLPDRTFSATEKRGLQRLPHVAAENLLAGDFSRQMNDYFSDQFPMRDALVSLKGACELASGRGENNGILLGRNGQLAKRLFDVRTVSGALLSDSDVFDEGNIRKAAEGLSRVGKALDVPFVALLPPRTLDVAASAFAYPTDYSDRLAACMREGIGTDTRYLDMMRFYRERYENGEYVYYKTDHHWTTLGAYLAYAEIMRAFGKEEEILAESAFEKKTADDRFYGTFYAAGGMRFVSADCLELWYRGNEDAFEVTADGVALDGLYSTDHLLSGDSYSVFLDGTHDVVTVTKAEEKRPRLVIFKDSFANALAPFLAQHFDLVLLNLSSVRQDFTNVTALSREWDADAVLLVYTLGNVINTDRLCRLQ